MAKMKHEMKVMRYLAEHGTITVREAFIHLKINSPTKVFSDMRRHGVKLVSKVIAKDGTKMYMIEKKGA